MHSYDCFISYASPDLAHAEALHRLLAGAGFRVWFDKIHLRERDGAQWHREIEAGCEASRVVLPILTRHWKLSEWTRYETYGAEAVIPILAEGAWDEVRTPPLARWQTHLVSGTLDPSRLIASVRNLLGQPAPAKSARVAHMRHRPTPYFVGRERELNDIHEKLFTSPVTVLTQGRVVAITALGGVGKTTLARQYAEKYWRCYQQMFWADCRLNLDGEFVRIHDILRPEMASLKDADKAAWVRWEFNRPEGPLRLLILDNAEDEQAILESIPRTGNCHTLITSRFAGWSQGVETYPVWVLEPEPASEFLTRRTERDDAGGADALAEKLGYLPLALEQAAAYILAQGAGFGFADYLRLYERFERELLAHKAAGATDYPDSVYLTWRATIDKLAPGARAILRLCAFLAPAPVPTGVLIKGAAVLNEQASAMGLSEPVEANEMDVRAWKADLARYSMIQLGADETFLVHGLVQAVERRQAPEPEWPRLVERAIGLLMTWAPRPSHEYSNWPAWRILEPHAARLWEAVSAGGVAATPPPVFLSELGMFRMVALRSSDSAEALLERALRDCERVLGVEHPDTLGSVNNLAVLYESQGRYGEAEPLYVRALRAAHPSPLVAVNNLAGLYASQGRYGEAEPLYVRALQDSERLLGAEHPSTLISVNNLASLYESQGRYDEAEPLLVRALRHRERVLGAEHPDTLGSVNNLAALYASQGRYGEAEQLYVRALRDRERVLGAEHPDTLVSVNNLAGLYESQGKYGEAEPLYVRGLRDCERVLGAAHPQTLVSVNNLAFLYERQGRHDEAEPLYVRALRDSERVLGAEHPQTLGSVNNLALLYESQGRYGEAESLYARALEARERVLGAEHPDTLVSVNNLAGLYASQGRYGEAEPLFVRALRDSERVLGAQHPDTLGSVNNLAGLYERQGRCGEAEPLYLQALRDSERVLGADHPNTLASVNNLAVLYERQGRCDEAEPLYLRALAGAERILGRDHPHTRTFRENLERFRRKRNG